MLYLATISFSGKINMAKGKIGEIADQSLADDLLRAGYIIPYESTEKKVEAKPKRKGGKKNED
jgi:hypothetical protein